MTDARNGALNPELPVAAETLIDADRAALIGRRLWFCQEAKRKPPKAAAGAVCPQARKARALEDISRR